MVFYLRKTRPEEQLKGFQENPKTFIGRKLSRQKITGNFATNRKQNKIIVIQMFQTRISMLSLLHFAKIFFYHFVRSRGRIQFKLRTATKMTKQKQTVFLKRYISRLNKNRSSQIRTQDFCSPRHISCLQTKNAGDQKKIEFIMN